MSGEKKKKVGSQALVVKSSQLEEQEKGQLKSVSTYVYLWTGMFYLPV